VRFLSLLVLVACIGGVLSFIAIRLVLTPLSPLSVYVVIPAVASLAIIAALIILWPLASLSRPVRPRGRSRYN